MSTNATTIVTVTTGDIWLAQLGRTVGSEIQKTRPCIVVSPPEMNAHLHTVVVAPMTTGSRPAAFRVPITFQGKSGLILLDQIRTLDKSRLLRREGAAHKATVSRALTTLQAMFAP
jgi:mRNA interferase MazF